MRSKASGWAGAEEFLRLKSSSGGQCMRLHSASSFALTCVSMAEADPSLQTPPGRTISACFVKIHVRVRAMIGTPCVVILPFTIKDFLVAFPVFWVFPPLGRSTVKVMVERVLLLYSGR